MFLGLAPGHRAPGSASEQGERLISWLTSCRVSAELAPAYVFLASNDATCITGVVLPVTDGRPML